MWYKWMDLGVVPPIDACRPDVVHVEVRIRLVEVPERGLRLALDAAEDGREHAWCLRCTFAGDVHKCEVGLGMEGGEGFRCGKGVIVGDFVVFSTTPLD